MRMFLRGDTGRLPGVIDEEPREPHEPLALPPDQPEPLPQEPGPDDPDTGIQPGDPDTGMPPVTAEGGDAAGLDLPPVPPPPPDNSPLSIEGTFAQPGTVGARPFWTPNFAQGRVVGPVVGPTGPGVPFSGQDRGNGSEEADFIRRVVMRRRG